MPLCPYCKNQVTINAGNDEYEQSAEGPREVRRETKGIVKKEIMYSCPHCDHVLGFGHYIGGLLTGRP